MKYFKSLLIFFAITTLLTGCTLKGTYNDNYISKELKNNLPKIQKNICITELSDIEMSVGNKSILYATSEINKNILTKYLEQYFNKISTDNCYVVIQSKILNVKSKFTNLDGMDAEFDINIKLLKMQNKILDKTYHGYRNSNVMIATGIFGGTRPFDTGLEAFHKELLHLYETEIESDILNALKDNY